MAATVTLLLPGAARLGRQRLGADVLLALGRADHVEHAGGGRRAQLLRHFQPSEGGWPLAALTRNVDMGDAGRGGWLRADPAHVRPDSNGARLMACGEALVLDAEDVAALLPGLQALFADAGLALDAPTPSRWYLRLPGGEPLPAFADPDTALGEDLFEHQPEGPGARRWRGLLNEAQVLLHNHPWNARRAALGKPPVNALWCWGGGVAPTQVRTLQATTCSDDESTRALALAGGGAVEALPEGFVEPSGSILFDLHALRDTALLQRAWLAPALAGVRGGGVRRLALDFADGQEFAIEPRQRWRLWRKPLATLRGSP